MKKGKCTLENITKNIIIHKKLIVGYVLGNLITKRILMH